jgi:hypothetical protein
VKPGMAHKLTLCVLLAALLLAVGCAYTAVTQKTPLPEPGPPVSTGAAAVMPQVVDNRGWPGVHTDEPIPHVRLFVPQISDLLRQNLVKSGLFKALYKPGDAAAADIGDRLNITLGAFSLQKKQHNKWVLPHLLADGLLLPVFAVTTLASSGEVDLGGYYIPSSTAATTLQAKVVYTDTENNLTLVNRSYLVDHRLGEVSDRDLRSGILKQGDYGAELGKQEGKTALDMLVEQISRDPYWASLNDFRKLALAEQKGTPQSPLADKISAAKSVAGLLRPIAYTADEIAVIRDSTLDASKRAGIISDLRERRWGVTFPEEKRISEEEVQKMFNDPKVDRSKVDEVIAKRVLNLAMRALTPPPPAPKAEPQEADPDEGTPTGEIKKVIQAEQKASNGAPPDPPDAAAMRGELTKLLAARFKGRPQLTELLLAHADLSVGYRWQPMAELLAAINSPQTKRYLARRSG